VDPGQLERLALGWHDFYLAVGGGAAALLGLLFVAVSLNLDDIADRARLDLRVLAEQAFSNFLNALLIALFVLVPSPFLTAQNLGLELGAVAALGLGRIVLRMSRAVRSGRLLWGPGYLVRRLGAPAAANLCLVVAAVELGAGDQSAFIWLLAATLTFLLTAADGSWDLLLRVGTERQARRAPPAEPTPADAPSPR
jgi:hypothetical protein